METAPHQRGSGPEASVAAPGTGVTAERHGQSHRGLGELAPARAQVLAEGRGLGGPPRQFPGKELGFGIRRPEL